ncbi:MAG: hypothetical protein QXR60_02650 [Candidatus Nanoarchaeia archaeon]
MRFNKNYIVFAFLFFVIGLTLYVSLSTKIIFHDTPEYFEVTKDLAGYGNVGVYSTHSFVYTYFISFFVKIFPSILIIKLINMFWLILDAFLLSIFFNDKRVFLLFIFSPMVWIVSIQYSPILPCSFFILLMYTTFMRWESTGNKSYFFVSALSGGLTLALYEPSLIILLFFLVAFFYKKSFCTTLAFSFLMLPTFSLRLILDYFLTGFPFYSIVRYFGTNLAAVFGFNPGTKGFFHGFFSIETAYSPFLILPLIFLFFKVDFSKNKRLLLFVLLSSLFLFVRGGLVKYFLLIAPFIFVLLSPLMTKKLLVFNSILSVILIVLFSIPFFGADPTTLIYDDMRSIYTYYPSEHYIDGAYVSLYYWGDQYKFYNIYEYLHSVSNRPYYSDYGTVVNNKKVNLYQILELKAALKPNYGEDIITSPLIMKKNDTPLEGFKLLKCYQYLCVYTKVKNEVRRCLCS